MLAPPFFSDKQLEFFATSDAYFNIAHGAVRAGKTHTCLYRFLDHALFGPPGTMMILGVTRDTIEANVVEPLMEMCPALQYNRGLSILKLGKRVIRLRGAPDEAAERKVRGATLAGAYVNELTQIPEKVINQLTFRTSVPGAKIFADTNPDSPFSWVKELIDQGRLSGRVKDYHFALDDNPTLSPEYKANIIALYPSGLFHRRFILGEWVQAQGAIYEQFNPDVHVLRWWPQGAPDKVVVGIDYGTINPTCFLMLGRFDRTWYVLREYYHDSIKAGRQKTDAEYAADFTQFIAGRGYPDPFDSLFPSAIELDPSAASFRLELKRHGVSRVYLADNDVLDGIRNVSAALTNGELLIHESCKRTIQETTSYVWDDKKQKERGEDAPLKTEDHAMDALRYACFKAFGKKGLQLVATA